MEYKSLKDLPEISQINGKDMLLVSIFDEDRRVFQSGSIKWADVKSEFADQIKTLSGADDWFIIPNLSSGNVQANSLSVRDGLALGPGALSGQISVGIRYVPGDGRPGSGSGAIVAQNPDGSISSAVGLDYILSGIADARPISSVSISPDNKYIVFSLQTEYVAEWGDTRGRQPLGKPISADNFLYGYKDGLTVLTAEGKTPSVALDWDTVYATFAAGSRTMSVPELSAGSISSYGGVISGATLDRVSAVSLSAGGYDVGDTLCSLVSGLSAANDKIKRTLSTHVELVELEYNEVSSIDDIVREKFPAVDWEDGDVIVVKTRLYAAEGEGEATVDKRPCQHQAYVYAGDEADPRWYAMDGTYSADSVVFSDDITLAGAYTSVGNVKITDGVLSAKGRTVKALFNEIFDKTISAELGRDPSLAGFGISFGDPEVGKSGYVYFGITYNSGTYLQPWDGSHVPTSANIRLSVESQLGRKVYEGQLSSLLSSWSNQQFPTGITITDDTVITAVATVQYDEGRSASNNKGQKTGLKSPPGSKSLSASNVVRGYRKYFWGSHVSGDTDIDCHSISVLLPNNSSKAAASGDSFKISILSGDTRAAFAYPSASGLACRVVDDAQKVDITPAFTESLVRIGGFKRDENEIDYKLYQTNINIAGGGASAANTYTVTFL